VGDVQIAAPVFLAPMSGVTDAPFRRQADRFGAPAVVTEMVAGAELARETEEFVRRAAPHNGSGPFIVQLAGRDPEWMRVGAELSEAAGGHHRHQHGLPGEKGHGRSIRLRADA